MSKRTRKLLMILLSLALAVSPLRGAWATPMSAAAEDVTPCASMQHDMNVAGPAMAMSDHATGSGYVCIDDCKGTCCDGACTHATPALAYTTPVTAGALNIFLNNTPADTFPERSLTPPLRPPAPLHS